MPVSKYIPNIVHSQVIALDSYCKWAYFSKSEICQSCSDSKFVQFKGKGHSKPIFSVFCILSQNCQQL